VACSQAYGERGFAVKSGVRASRGVAAALAAFLAITGCSQLQKASTSNSPPTPASGPESFSDLLKTGNLTANPQPKAANVASGTTDAPKNANTEPVIYDGTPVGPQQVTPNPSQPAASREGITNVAYTVADTGVAPTEDGKFQVTFENADINGVVRAILGDALKSNYLIDPRIHGTISLSTRRPVSSSQLLLLLETALQSQGAIMVHGNDAYRILPSSQVAGVGGTNIGPDAGPQGFGITALPLQNVSAEALNKLLVGFGASPDSVHVDAAHNLLIVRGTTSDRQWFIDTALAFDVDWMRNQSVGVFPISTSSPEEVINELNQLADTSVVKFQPIARLNAVLAVGKSPEVIRQVQAWISRLDRSNNYGPQAHVYRLKIADARRVVSVLKETFGAGGSSPESEQVAPQGGLAAAAAAPVPAAATGPGAASTPIAHGPTGPPPGESRAGEFGLGGGPGGAGSAEQIRITADPVTNSVVVYASLEQYKAIERAIIGLDRPTPEVAIEAIAAEVTLNDNLNYGVQFFLQSAVKGSPGSGIIPIATSQLSAAGTPLGQVAAAANFVLGQLSNPAVVINALRDVTDVKVLSSPSLVVADNQAAVLQVGDQIPVTTGTATSVITTQSAIVNSVSYVDTGVILHVTPHVSRTGQVRLDIEQEVSAVEQNANALTLTPTISQQKVKSTVVVDNGQTVLLAGMIQQQGSQEKSGVPGVIDIPLLGNLVSNSTNGAKRTELIIFVKPQVIHDNVDAQEIAQELHRRMPGFSTW
jgi:general secretion pathway protein D